MTVFVLLLLVLWLKGGIGGVGPEPLQRAGQAERTKASEAGQSSRMRAVVYLMVGTRQTKNPNITPTKNCTCRRLKTVSKMDKKADSGNRKQT